MNLKIFSFLLFIYFTAGTVNAQKTVKICSWNIQNFGKSKPDSSIYYMADKLKIYDVIAIQEVVAGYGGSQAVAKLVNALNRKGYSWDYSVSNPTTSDNKYKKERYAFIWKSKKIKKIGDAWLEKTYQLQIDREPYLITLKAENKIFTLVSYHAITKAEKPETEIKYFKFLPTIYPKLNLIFCGDFNCPQSHSVFSPLKSMGYKPVLIGQKTSLRQKCLLTGCLASEYDNAFFDTSKATLINSGIVHFYTDFESIKAAKKISDHVPIFFELILN